MTTKPTCADCSETLEIGFIPDATIGPVKQSHWHPGAAVHERFVGLEAYDKRGVKTDWEQAVPVTAYRCPRCGLVKIYALRDAD